MRPTDALALFGNIGTGEIIFLILLILIFFGANKIPELARSLGRAQKEFNKARQELEDTAPVPPSEEERVRKAARDLGIEAEGRDLDEVRRLIAEKMGAAGTTPPSWKQAP